MRKCEKITAGIVFLLITIGVITTYFKDTVLYTDFFRGFYVAENGIIESLTVIALLCGAGVCFYRASKLIAVRRRIFIALLIAIGCLYLFGAGEELSWGQSLFGNQSPDFFVKHNAQEEMNFHNLVIGEIKINKLVFGTVLGIIIVVYLSLVPLLYRTKQSFKRFVDLCALPIPRISHIICYIILGILIGLTHSSKKGELMEFGGCWIFFLMTLNPYNRDIFITESS